MNMYVYIVWSVTVTKEKITSVSTFPQLYPSNYQWCAILTAHRSKYENFNWKFVLRFNNYGYESMCIYIVGSITVIQDKITLVTIFAQLYPSNCHWTMMCQIHIRVIDTTPRLVQIVWGHLNLGHFFCL